MVACVITDNLLATFKVHKHLKLLQERLKLANTDYNTSSVLYNL